MLPFLAVMGVAGAAAKTFGGFLQAGEIEKATAERLRLMRLHAGKEQGDYTAAVGGTGVEFTSGTIQNTLNRMRAESDRQMSLVRDAGGDAAMNARLAAGAQGFSSLASSLYSASKVSAALGEAPPSIEDPLAKVQLQDKFSDKWWD